MANRYSVATGLASANSTWDGGASVPGTGDRVLICTGHTVTIDGTTEWGDDSTSTITINSVSTTASVTVAGTLTHSITANTQLTLNGGMNVVSGGTYNIGTEANPVPSTYTATLLLNKSASLGDGKYALVVRTGGAFNVCGATKRKVTTLTATAAAAATTVFVTDATGWQIGDQIYLANTSDYSGDLQETRTIAGTYTPGSLTVPITVALTNQHLDDCPIANYTSNVTVKNYSEANRGHVVIIQGSTSLADQTSFIDCTFDNIGRYDDGAGIVFGSDSNFGTTAYPQPVKQVRRVATIARVGDSCLYMWYNIVGTVPVRCYEVAGLSLSTGSGAMALKDRGMGEYTDCLFAAATTIEIATAAGTNFTRGYLCGTVDNGSGITSSSRALALDGTKFSGPARGALVRVATGGAGPINMTADNCDIGETFTRGYEVMNSSTYGGAFSITAKNSHIGSLTAMDSGTQLSMVGSSFLKLVNKNRDVTNQEEWYQRGKIIRDNSVTNRSTSSMRMTPSIAGTAFTRSFTIAVATGEVLRLIGYCRYDTTYYNGGTGFVAPTMTLSGTINGVALTPVVYTAPSANAGNWDLIDASITNTGGAAGEITVTFSTQCTPTTGNVYWDGIAVAPMVVTARHYGFLFDESNPKRVVNSSISASFATADAYTGITITWGSTSTTALTASKTFQVLYDYSQAKGVQNLTSSMPFNGAGAVNNVSLTAAGNITTTGYTLNGGGSLTMGAFTLTASIPWVYTYTGGTFSQATAVLSFSGGTLNIGAAATYTFSGSSMIVSMTPTGASTYALGAGTFSGTIDLRNTSAFAITVQVPGGTTTTTANNTGGTITVSAPTVTKGQTYTGLQTGSQVIFFATGTQTEIQRNNSTTATETWSTAGGTDTTFDATILKAGFLPIHIIGVTVNASVRSDAIVQVVDRAYVASSGLTYGTTATYNRGTKRFAVSAVTSPQNWYSFTMEAWIAQSALANTPFPLVSNGPNSFSAVADWEFTTEANIVDYFRGDGFRYVNTAGTRTAVWAALQTSGVPSGTQVRYQQTDGGAQANTIATGEVNQLVKVFGDATHGNFDRTGYLVVKAQRDGYDQAEADVVALYGTLEDQLYVFGLVPALNGLATGAPTVNGSPTITDHAGSPVTWNSKAFSITITDSAAGNTGTTLMRWLRYNFGLGGTFQGKDGFNWHDLIQVNGSAYKTVRGKLYGDTGATLKGVRVITNAGAQHPDFTMHTADDGTTFVPTFPAAAAATVLTDTRVQLYNVTTSTELDNSFVTGTAYSFTVTSGVTVGDTVRLRACKKGRMAAEATAVWAAAGVTFLISQPEDTIYTAWGIDGATVSEYSLDGTNLQIDANDVDGSTQKVRLAAFYSYALTLEAGIRLFYGALTFLAAGSIRVNVDVVNSRIDNVNASTPLVFTDVNVRLFRSDGSSIIAPTSYTIHSDYSGEPFTVETGVSGLTGAESAQLLALPSASATADAVWAKTLP